ncbi:MAG: hypothetical protein UX68_C0022G0018 [Parcubacteria group bacterium GW2011_GWA2_46_9]|nr:MAG: hypothetical protein UX68_C0022G0018 [Parcubacteria group bacterium GW2011_GWA2_46_9]
MTKRILVVIVLIALTAPSIANAAFPEDPLIPSGCISSQGYDAQGRPLPREECGLKEMVKVAVNISKLILGVLGSVTLLFFIYGGFVWITAAGNTQRIEQGKKVFESALVGLIIVLSSWLIIYFITAALTGTPVGEQVKLFNGGGEPFQLPPER